MGMRNLTNRLLARLFSRVPGLAEQWGKKLAPDTGTIPWSSPDKPLREAVVALVTTGGIHRATDPPFDMSSPEGDASLREVAADVAPADLVITHDYYDHRDAETDLNLVMPAERLRELVAAGAIGGLHSPVYSLMGHIEGHQLKLLRERTAPRLAALLAAAGVDYAFLVPA